MIEKGSKVKIDFSTLDLLESELKAIRGFDEQYNGLHTVSNIYIKGAYTGHEVKRIELDKDFVFYEKELIEVK